MSRAFQQNGFLAAVPAADLGRWRPHLKPVRLAVGDVLQRRGERPAHAYFPTSAIISLSYAASGHRAVESAMVGREGVLASASPMADAVGASHWAIVQSEGWGFRLDAVRVWDGDDTRALQGLFLRHTLAVSSQVALTASCGRSHRLADQLSRWMLQSLDRREDTDLLTTQAALAIRLGVRRASVSDCVREMETEGLVHSARGRISVVDRAELELRSCDCYRMIRGEYEGLGLNR